MSTMESLRLLLDNANGEKQRLEAENWRFREDHLERAVVAELSSEVQQMKELYEQVRGSILRKDDQAEVSRWEIALTCSRTRSSTTFCTTWRRTRL